MIKTIINADDFGISPGVNAAIVTAFQKGCLNSTSLMMNVAYTEAAVKALRQLKGLSVGIHLNLTCQRAQKALSCPKDIPLLVNKQGHLKNGFLSFLLLSFFHKKQLQKQVEKEMRAQIEKALKLGIHPTHLDSHRHVHMIPALFSVVQKLQKEYQIERIRVVNEHLFKTFFQTRDFSCLWNGGLIKWFVLRGCSLFCRYPIQTYFYSIIYTTRLFGRATQKICVPKGYSQIEIAFHPSIITIDQAQYEVQFDDYLLKRYDRQAEFETLLDTSFPERIQG